MLCAVGVVGTQSSLDPVVKSLFMTSIILSMPKQKGVENAPSGMGGWGGGAARWVYVACQPLVIQGVCRALVGVSDAEAGLHGPPPPQRVAARSAETSAADRTSGASLRMCEIIRDSSRPFEIVRRVATGAVAAAAFCARRPC